MGLIIILIVISIIISAILANHNWGFQFGEFIIWFMLFVMLSVVLFSVIQLLGCNINRQEKIVNYTVKIVSLKDNSQINGSGSFLSRINIDEEEYFSFYKVNADGSYSMDKKITRNSVIIPDATPENSYIKITDKITWNSLKNNWWFIFEDTTEHGDYLHGEFHVPANSIKNDYVLDAE